WNLAVQREIVWGMVWEGTYIGSKGSKLLLNWNPNQLYNDPDPAAAALPRRPLGAIVGNTGISESATFGFSRYHAFATQLEKRYSNGLDFRAAYTWGHALTNLGTTLAGGPGVRDIRNISAEYSHANFHIKHRFVYSWQYDLPFGRGRKYGAGLNRASDLVVGGWQLNGIMTLQSGNARNIGTRESSCGCGGERRPDLVPGKNPNDAPSGGRTPDRWFDVTAVQAPARGTFGNLGHYAVYAPGIKSLDLSAFKDFPITERYRFQLRAEWFNFTNTPLFDPGSLQGTQGDSAIGRLTATSPGSERHMQFALRFQF
ncbi:MAG: carboxypeptidase regulatory-like domain-containing protein, partial [Bryobacteraceae bacterium]